MDRIYEAYEGQFGEAFMKKTRERIHWLCAQVTGSRVLDVGCSQGIGPILLGREGFSVTGLDVNPQAIDYAGAMLEKEPENVRGRVKLICGNLMDFDGEDAGYDTIVCGEILEHLIRPDLFMRKLHSLLNEGGMLVVTVPFGINDDPDHKQTFYFASVYKLLYPLFTLESVKMFGKWIGFTARRRDEICEDEPRLTLSEYMPVEDEFYKVERELLTARQSALSERDNAAKQMKSAIGERDALSKQLSQTANERDTLTKQLSQTTDERDSLTKQLSQTTDERDSLEKQLSQTTDERDALEKQLSQTTDERDSLTKQLSQATNERDALTEQLSQVTDERDSLTEQLSQTASERDALTEQLSQATNERDALSKQLSQTTNERDALAQELLKMREALEENKKRERLYQEELRKNSAEWEREANLLISAKNQIQQLSAQAAQLKEHNSIYEGKLQKVYGTWYGRFILRVYKTLKRIKQAIIKP